MIIEMMKVARENEISQNKAHGKPAQYVAIFTFEMKLPHQLLMNMYDGQGVLLFTSKSGWSF